jgi:hypothetical protein
MQEFIQSVIFVVLNAMGLLALLLILGYTVYGEDQDEE